jgi:site-specific recombinase XerD
MGLYRRKDSRDWWMSFTDDKRNPCRRSTGTSDRKLAEKIFAKVKTQVVEAKFFELDEAKKHTFDEMMERFMIEHAPTKEPSMQKSYRVSLAHLTDFFLGLTLDKIDTDAVLRYVAHRRSQNNSKPGTRNREIAMLSKAFNLARLWKWVKENPCQLVKREKEDNEIGRCLTDDEEQRLLQACWHYLGGQLAEMVTIALNTGMREGEILKLRWDQIDMKGKVINTINEKSNKPKTVAMNESVFDLLQDKSKIMSISGYVFTTSNDSSFHARNMLRAWYKAVKEAKIEGGLRFHDLRHTVGSRIIRAGRDIHAVAAVLDHSQLSTTRRYAKHDTESMRKVVNLLDKKNDFHDSFTLGQDADKVMLVTP